ncbi:MAG: PIN domain-containing protein [Calditrichia bacterium]
MIILDTSVWIEFFKRNNPYFEHVEMLLNKNSVLTFELVFAELLQGAKNERERKILEGYWNNLPKVSVEEIIFRAGMEAGRRKYFSKGIGLIDSAIIQLAKETASTVWSLDKKLDTVLEKDQIYMFPPV